MVVEYDPLIWLVSWSYNNISTIAKQFIFPCALFSLPFSSTSPSSSPTIPTQDCNLKQKICASEYLSNPELQRNAQSWKRVIQGNCLITTLSRESDKAWFMFLNFCSILNILVFGGKTWQTWSFSAMSIAYFLKLSFDLKSTKRKYSSIMALKLDFSPEDEEEERRKWEEQEKRKNWIFRPLNRK